MVCKTKHPLQTERNHVVKDKKRPLPHVPTQYQNHDIGQQNEKKEVAFRRTAKKSSPELEKKDTSWTRSGQWYDSIVGEKGHFYHQHVILPKLHQLCPILAGMKIIDLGCGQGVLARAIPQKTSYVGIDLSQPLIQQAKIYFNQDRSKKYLPSSSHSRIFVTHDLTKTPWPLQHCPNNEFDVAVSILALQNIKEPWFIFQETYRCLKPGGKAVFVINHPYFRIPRKTRWAFDEKTKTQTREVFSYMTAQEIPIVTHPGKQCTKSDDIVTWSYHYPLQDYSRWIYEAGLHIRIIEEWCSTKTSYGSSAKWENKARNEFPLFMALCLVKPLPKLSQS